MAKESPSPHEGRLSLLETNSVFQCLTGEFINASMLSLNNANSLFCSIFIVSIAFDSTHIRLIML